MIEQETCEVSSRDSPESTLASAALPGTGFRNINFITERSFYYGCAYSHRKSKKVLEP